MSVEHYRLLFLALLARLLLLLPCDERDFEQTWPEFVSIGIYFHQMAPVLRLPMEVVWADIFVIQSNEDIYIDPIMIGCL